MTDEELKIYLLLNGWNKANDDYTYGFYDRSDSKHCLSIDWGNYYAYTLNGTKKKRIEVDTPEELTKLIEKHKAEYYYE